MISKALNDGQISTEEFQLVLCELDRYNDFKEKTHTKQSGLSEQEKKEVNRRREITGTGAIQKKFVCHQFGLLCKKFKKKKNKFVFLNDPPPAY